MPAERASERTRSRRIYEFGAAGYRGSGHSAAQRFRHGYQVRLDSEMFAGEPLPGAAKSGLHLIRNKQDAVLAASLLQNLEIISRRHNKAAFAQNRFGNDRGHRFRRDLALECIFKMISEARCVCAALRTVRVREGNAVNVAGKRLKSSLVRMRLAGERHGQQRAPVKSILKANYRRALGVSASDFNGVLDRFRPGIHDNGFLTGLAGGKRVELLRQSDVALIRRNRKAQMP